MGAEVPLEGCVARESAVALAANIAADSGVHLHVLLQSSLCLEPFPAQKAEHCHVRA